jgi:hypothetical protein
MLTAKLDQLTHADLRKDSRTSVMFFTLTGAYINGLYIAAGCTRGYLYCAPLGLRNLASKD